MPAEQGGGVALGTGLRRAALALVLAALPAAADEVSGAARVIDGDTLAIGATKVRLLGIDAPESRQRCGCSGAEWACGEIAAARLTALAGAAVRCSGDEHDRYGRLIATCSADGVDLGGRMVADGLAWAYVHFSELYVADETRARSRRVGLWGGAAEAPWDFRADGGFAPASGTVATPPAGCLIKGNISGGGARIYHMPGEGSYAQTRIDPKRGEAWFCDEVSARAAGFRPQRGAGG